MGRLVGIDFGNVRIGLAISDAQKRIALPLKVIRAGKDFKATSELICKELSSYQGIEAAVIGLPLELSGKEGPMAQAVRAFAVLFQEVSSLPIIFWDERLTSAQVERFLKDAGMNRKKRAQHSDEMAATTILQNYLDSLQYVSDQNKRPL